MSADHPTIETIADSRALLLPPEQQAYVTAHLSACADCAAAAEAVAEVSSLLAQSRADVVPMPDGVAAKLDAALRHAGAERASTVVPLARQPASAPRNRHRAWPLLAAAAAAVIAVSVVRIGDLDPFGGSSTSSATARDSAADTPANGAAPGAEGYRSSPNKSSARVHLEELSPAKLAPYADGIVADTAARAAVAKGCASVPTPDGDIVSGARWQGEPAIVVIDPARREVTVLDCKTASLVLFRTDY